MMTEPDSLKCLGQCPPWMQGLARSRRFRSAAGSLTTSFNSDHVMWSGPGDERLEHDSSASESSSAENGGHSLSIRFGSGSRTDISTTRPEGELYVLWSAFHRESIPWQDCPWYRIASHAGNLRCLTHSIRSHGRLLAYAISPILVSKNSRLTRLTVSRKRYQFTSDLSFRYVASLAEHSLFHHG